MEVTQAFNQQFVGSLDQSVPLTPFLVTIYSMTKMNDTRCSSLDKT